MKQFRHSRIPKFSQPTQPLWADLKEGKGEGGKDGRVRVRGWIREVGSEGEGGSDEREKRGVGKRERGKGFKTDLGTKWTLSNIVLLKCIFLFS